MRNYENAKLSTSIPENLATKIDFLSNELKFKADENPGFKIRTSGSALKVLEEASPIVDVTDSEDKNFTFSDENENGLHDTLTWEASLSNKTFHIEEIILEESLEIITKDANGDIVDFSESIFNYG